ncbi:ArnT family glycosyltransferase [Nocardia sp. NPDC020380]|uniref:ArnT family glycosyltransferase n=1 Tax=Nocardia sp. NPDC020380 TaxID=3364309 RepID=UPI00379A2751
MLATKPGPDADSTRSDAPETGAQAPARVWERVALAVLLVGTAGAYLWRISVNDMADNFYAAAVWSGTQDWKALLFGSIDPGNFITVDKPPLSLWVMGMSARVFGFGSASMLAPQALMAVGAVALLYATVTRVVGSRGAGLLAGAALALTPVVALMFRYNHPDAAMVLLMTAAAYCVVRALPTANVRWLMFAGVALGFAFLAKMLEGLMVLPAFGLAYLIAAPVALRSRLLHLVWAAVALIVSAGWYVVLTMLWPTASRPYLAGSTDNSLLNVVFGFNGFDRMLGRGAGGHTGGHISLPPGYRIPPQLVQSFNDFGSAGPTRLFHGESGFQISWLLPAALVAFGLTLVSRRHAPRTDMIRSGALIFGLWMLTVGLAFSLAGSLEHAYYVVAIAPAIAATLVIGSHELWRRRDEAFGRLGAAAVIATAGIWGFLVLQHNSTWHPELRGTLVIAAIAAALGLTATTLPIPSIVRRPATAILLIVGIIAALSGPAAYTAATLPQAHSGRSPVVGPPPPPETGFAAIIRTQMRSFADGGAFTDQRILTMLTSTTTDWSAAVERSSVAAAIELATRTPVISIGGFANTDPAPTLEQFQNLVHAGRVTYYLAQELHLPPTWRVGDAPLRTEPWTAAERRDIADWVTANFTPTRIGSVAVYDLTAPKN